VRLSLTRSLSVRVRVRVCVCVCVFLRGTPACRSVFAALIIDAAVTTSRRTNVCSGQIFVTRLDDRTVSINTKSNDTVLSVVKQVPGSDRFVFRGKELDDETTLLYAGIQN